MTSPKLAATGVTGDADKDSLLLVDPELRPVLVAMQATAAAAQPGTSSSSGSHLKLEPIASPAYRKVMVPGLHGAPDVPVYVVNDKPGLARPGVLHMHGGGFFRGEPVQFMRLLQEMAAALDIVVVSVDYRLAPTTLFSGSCDDNYAALQWAHGHVEEIGLDRNRIAIMGESAGGGHAALLALAARDRGEIQIVLQMLIYPMLDDRTGVTRPIPAHSDIFVWKPETNTAGWTAFLGQAAGGSVPDGAVPARVKNLAGLPPTFIGVGALDMLVGESMDYGRRLIEAGVSTELFVAPGAYHAFEMLASEAAISRTFTSAKYDALRRAFH